MVSSVHPVFLQRLVSQGIAHPTADEPRDVVRRLLAVQSQNFGPGCWSLAQRMTPTPPSERVAAAYDRGEILRTHVLRPTWHFVTPRDIGWLLELTGPRIERANASMYPRYGLTPALLEAAAAQIADHLDDGRHATRAELAADLVAAGVLRQPELQASSVGLSLVVMYAELAGLICSGARRGKQHTYALLARRAPDAVRWEREEALGELVVRYVAGHGPTTLPDLRAWASLPLRDLQTGLAVAGERVASVEIGGESYLVASDEAGPGTGRPDEARPGTAKMAPLLLQAFDELVMGYTPTRELIAGTSGRGVELDPAFPSANPVLIDGVLRGWWSRTEGKRVVVSLSAMSAAARRALRPELRRLEAFSGVAVVVEEH